MNDSVKKIRFALDDGVVEIMHVRLLPDVSLVLDNIPFYAYGVSCGDTIATERDEDGLMFVGVLARGGHSTYRVRLPAFAGDERFLMRWSELEVLGCTYEGSNVGERLLYAVDVPSHAAVAEVYRLLEQGESEGDWEFEEGFYCSPDFISSELH